jgi:hypothetical protein
MVTLEQTRQTPRRQILSGTKGHPMLSHFAAPVAHLLKKNGPPSPTPAPGKGVAQLLEALAETRARKAELERQEKELIAATQAKLREQQQSLDELRNRVRDSGIDIDGVPPAPTSGGAR